MIEKLPEGWAGVELAEAVGPGGVFVDGDWVESKDQDPTGDVRLIQLADIGDGTYRNRSARFLTSAKAAELGCTYLIPGDILVARMPEPLGRACIFPGDAKASVTVVDICIVRPGLGGILPRWLLHTINAPQFRSGIEEYERGTTRRRISRTNLGRLELPMPPLAEQHRIVAKVETLLSEVTAARNCLRRASAILERFRRSVLAAACSGRLTKEWRNSEPSSDDDGVPTSWQRTTIGDLVRVATGATPLRRKTDYYRGGNIPWVTSSVVNQIVVTQADEYITELALRETNAKVFPPGTLLVAMYGEGKTRGKVTELGIAAATNQALAALLFDEISAPLRPFLKIALQSQYVQNREVSAGGVQPNLSLSAVRAIPVAMPPAAEQREIMRRVERLLDLADKVQHHLASVRTNADRMTQSILAKAFRGELVPTEAELAQQEERDYEPALALLERVREQGASNGGESRQPPVHAKRRSKSARAPISVGGKRGSKRRPQRRGSPRAK